MFEWLNNLKPGDNVVIRDSAHLITGDPALEFTETVIEVTDDHIKTEPLNYKRPILAVWRLFCRRFGNSNSMQLIRKVA